MPRPAVGPVSPTAHEPRSPECSLLRLAAEANARDCAPATPRICRYLEMRGPWQNSPALRPVGVISQQINCLKFTDKPREFIYIYRIFQKFRPVPIQRFRGSNETDAGAIEATDEVADYRPESEDLRYASGGASYRTQ